MKLCWKLKLWEIGGLVDWSFSKVPRDFWKVFQNFENNDENWYEIENIGLYVEKCWKIMKNDESEFCNFELYGFLVSGLCVE